MTSLSACITTSIDKNILELEGQWEVTEMMSVNMETYYASKTYMRAPTFKIEEAKFSGFDGCNNFSGTVTLEEAGLKFDKGIQTLVACIVPEGEKSPDFLFNAAINRNPVFVKVAPGSYSIETNLPPEFRDWNMTKIGHLEFIKEGEVTLRAIPIAAD